MLKTRHVSGSPKPKWPISTTEKTSPVANTHLWVLDLYRPSKVIESLRKELDYGLQEATASSMTQRPGRWCLEWPLSDLTVHDHARGAVASHKRRKLCAWKPHIPLKGFTKQGK